MLFARNVKLKSERERTKGRRVKADITRSSNIHKTQTEIEGKEGLKRGKEEERKRERERIRGS